jgi:hypothetical protein
VSTPCERAPDDWFIDKKGLFHVEDCLVPEQVLAELDPEEIPGVEAEAKRQRLILRRRARQDCFDCPVRLQCLGLAIENQESHGIWGGYYAEQIGKIIAERDQRARRRL